MEFFGEADALLFYQNRKGGGAPGRLNSPCAFSRRIE